MKLMWKRKAARRDANGITDETYLQAAATAAQTEPAMTEDDLLVFPIVCGILRDSRPAAA